MFVDNGTDRAALLRLAEEVRKKPGKPSPAVMVGQIWSSDLADSLRELYPVLADEGFSLSTIARLMLEEADARSRH